MTNRDKIFFFSIGLLLPFALVVCCYSQNLSRSQIKSTFTYNLAHFVQWPQVSFKGRNSPFIIGILGQKNFDSTFYELEGRRIKDRKIKIKHLTDFAGLDTCHLLYVNSSFKHQYPIIFNIVGTLPVLTIGEDSDFTREGGIVRYFVVDNQIKIEINIKSAQRASLKINAMLLEIANVINR